jgi:glycerol-3-phosphate dehydrogenase
MAYYLIRYSLDDNNAYIYPESIAGVAWKTVVYNYTDQVMVGETDTSVKTDEKQVTYLTPDEAQKLMEEYQANYPKPENRQADLLA